MVITDICNALMAIRPGAEWTLRGNSLADLVWLDGVQTRPTDNEIQAAIAGYVPPLTLQEQIDALKQQVQTLTENQGA